MGIRRDRVKCLVFEGGGGKGNGFLGAIKALEELEIIRYENRRHTNLVGMGGSSAGAITGLLLTLGFNHYEIDYIMKSESALDFFDNDEYINVSPKYSYYNPETRSTVSEVLYTREPIVRDRFSISTQHGAFANLIIDSITHLNRREYSHALFEIIAALFGAEEDIRRGTFRGLDLYSLSFLLMYFKREAAPEVVDRLLRNRAQHMDNLLKHYGFFSGHRIHMFIKKWIHIGTYLLQFRYPNISTEGLRNARPPQNYNYPSDITAAPDLEKLNYLSNIYHFCLSDPQIRVQRGHFPTPPSTLGDEQINLIRLLSNHINVVGNPTFEDLFRLTRVNFLCTGTNLGTLKSQIFSHDTVPQFRVSDAVRISMSLPFVYKPILIERLVMPTRRGVSSNLPEFINGLWVDGGWMNNMPYNAFDKMPPHNYPKTLGIRLGVDNTSTIPLDFNGFIARFADSAMNANEARISETYDSNKSYCIELNVDPLETLTFQPNPQVFAQVNENTHRQVMSYFHQT